MTRANRILSWGLIVVFVFGFVFVPGGKVQAAPSTGPTFTVSVTALGSAYTQNFDTLANTGTANTWTDDTTPLVGWYAAKAVAPNNITLYRADTGASNAGALYSYGSSGSTERALGSVSSGTPGTIYYGVKFTNNTASTITSLDISYTGEQWRNGGNTNAQTLAFQYQVGAASLMTGAWTSFSALDFVTPTIGATAAALDGNAAPNRTARSSSITGLSVAPGGTIWLRWMDINDSGNDHGVSIDDLSVTPQGGVSTNPAGSGAANPGLVLAGDSTLLTVAVTSGTFPASTGLAVTCNLTSIGGSATQAFYDNATNGDVTAGDNTFSFSTAVSGGTSAGAKSLACTISDAQSRTGSATIGLTVLSILPVGTVNGPVLDTDDGTLHQSPFKGSTVTIQGVIYEKTLQAISNSSNVYYGFFIQNTSATKDADPNTSDGLFVFMNTTSTVSGYTPTVGDEVILSGMVSEYYNMTELTNPTLAKPVVRSSVVLDTELAPFVANPPVILADANRYWERRQGMRGQVPVNSIVLNGRNVFDPADAEIWVARPDSTIAGRSDPDARRAFRDAHPLDDNYSATIWDGNGYRILMGSLGIKATAGDAQALLVPARTFATVTNAPVGGVNYSFSKYRIEVTMQPTLSNGVDPAANNPPQTFDRRLGYSIVDYNLENLYDYRDNPFSGCDFTGNSGCPKVDPFLSAVTPPYNYVPVNDAVYQARLADIASQIINDMHSPDILMVQEVENQDICIVTGGVFSCGATDNADGKPDVLQELAVKIASLGGPAYDAAWDRDSSDLRGIAPAFLFRTDRVQLLPALSTDPVLGNNPIIGYSGTPAAFNSDISNPKTLNAVSAAVTTGCETSLVFPRAPDIALFRITPTSGGIGDSSDVYVINNHFKSSPDACVGPRTEQAKYNAAVVQAILAADPNARIVVGGDLNVYPRPDDIGFGASDQLGSLYNPALGLKNLWEVLAGEAPESAYSYVYLGMAQTLDQMFISQKLLADLQQFRLAHINSDFPADYTGDAARGTSDHDPNVAVFAFVVPGTPVGGSGGTDTSGPWTVTIPPGAVPSGSTLIMTDLDSGLEPGVGREMHSLLQFIEITVRVLGGSNLTNFTPPLEICYHYTDKELAGVAYNPLNFVIGTIPSGGTTWQLLATSVYPATKTVCVSANHLSRFEAFRRTTLIPATGFAPGRMTILPPQTVSYADLGDLWLEIPRLGVQMPIVGVPQSTDGWDVSWLGNDAGWLTGTAFPTYAGNSVLTGHVYAANGQPGPFVHLDWLWYGDKVIIHAWGAQYVYEVRQVTQVGAQSVSSVVQHEELPWVTLITCRGYNEASNSYKYRVAVRAVLVEVK